MRRCLLFIVAVTLLVHGWGQDKKQNPFGIDVSHHNGIICWEKVPDVEFVYIKATEENCSEKVGTGTCFTR
jgi:GH25 family lysozyme M1 (1,4-beta-N-acetylmuramidase)